MTLQGWSRLVLPGLLAVSGCAPLLPTKSADHTATVQFLSPGSESECVILRAHCDRVVLLLLNRRPRLEGLPEYLSRRGLSQVSDTVFLATPDAPPIFPEGVDWGTVWCSEAALPVLDRALWGDGDPPPARAVTQEVQLEIPGVVLRLLPTGASDQAEGHLVADLRHSGNRIVLVPAPAARAGLEIAGAEVPIDLLGLLPSERIPGLRLLPGMKDCRILVRGPGDLSDDRALYILSDRKRLVFQSTDDGLAALGQAHDFDT
ncbi:MAG: hypothetical protein V2A76_08900 [Planctomycetota bacterium]